jgi:hypothetical protein
MSRLVTHGRNDRTTANIMSADTECCVGCGATVPLAAGPVHRYVTAAPGCWAMYGELLARLLSDPQADRYRQLCVDAYAVQHPGHPNPQAIQSVVGHLISLYAQLELGLPTDAAAALLRRVTQRKGQYHWLTPPSFENVHTLGYVMDRPNELAEATREWAGAAWRAWSPHQAQIREWYGRLPSP